MSIQSETAQTPKLRFPEFSGEWEEKKLGDLGNFIGGGTPSKSVKEYWTGTIPWISSSDIYEHDIHNIQISRYINENSVKESATKIIPKNSVLFVSRVGVGKLAINKKEICTSQDFTNFLVKSDSIYFLGYFFLARNNLLVRYSQGTSIKGFTKNDIKLIKLLIPDFSEQQKIASFLTSVDSKIEQLGKKQELLCEYKKGLMQKIFSQELRFTADDGSHYLDWEEKRLGDLTYKVGKKNKENIQYPIYSINNQEGFRPQSEQFDGLDSNDRGYDISLYKIINQKTFAYNPARINIGSIGYSYNLNEVIISSLYVCFKTNDELEDLYLLSYLDTYKFNKDILRYEEGGVRQYLFYESFSQINIPLPSNDEQTKIANFLSSIDSKIEQIVKQLDESKQFKKALLQQMFV